MQNGLTININKDHKNKLIWYAYLDEINLRLKKLQTVNEHEYNYYSASDSHWREWLKKQAALDFNGDINRGILTFKNIELMTEFVLKYS